MRPTSKQLGNYTTKRVPQPPRKKRGQPKSSSESNSAEPCDDLLGRVAGLQQKSRSKLKGRAAAVKKKKLAQLKQELAHVKVKAEAKCAHELAQAVRSWHSRCPVDDLGALEELMKQRLTALELAHERRVRELQKEVARLRQDNEKLRKRKFVAPAQWEIAPSLCARCKAYVDLTSTLDFKLSKLGAVIH